MKSEIFVWHPGPYTNLNTTLLCILIQGSQSEWRNVFFMTGGVYLFGGLVYVFFGRGDIEQWAKNPVHIEHGNVNMEEKDKSEINPIFTLSEKEMVQKMESNINFAVTSSGKETLPNGLQADNSEIEQTVL